MATTNLPSRTSPAGSLISYSERMLESRCSSSDAAKAAAQLFGCYRRGDANDPETYALAVAAVLSCYPLEVVREVCDPRTGIPGKLKWLPVVAEVKEACEAAMEPHRRRVKSHQLERKQLAERGSPDVSPEARRKAAEAAERVAAEIRAAALSANDPFAEKPAA